MTTDDTSMDAPAHTPGTAKGEERVKDSGKEPGREEQETDDKGNSTSGPTARDSTGVSADDRNPIDPAMPNMPPA